LPSQSPKPALHVDRQVLAEQLGVAPGRVGQTVPQVPQWLRSVVRLTSQPLAGLPSQSAKPVLQVNPHVPPVQLLVALARAGQTLPQAPQLVTELVRLASQPLERLLSQLPKPVAHRAAQLLAAQTAMVLEALGQTLPQAPQCAGSLPVLVQAPPQSTSGDAQVVAQLPMPHT
jgi:hypothetical protein